MQLYVLYFINLSLSPFIKFETCASLSTPSLSLSYTLFLEPQTSKSCCSLCCSLCSFPDLNIFLNELSPSAPSLSLKRLSCCRGCSPCALTHTLSLSLSLSVSLSFARTGKVRPSASASGRTSHHKACDVNGNDYAGSANSSFRTGPTVQ